jgi:hypothetical protein
VCGVFRLRKDISCQTKIEIKPIQINSRKMINTKKCYIKRKNSEWQEGRAHHERALELYVTTYVEPGIMPETALIYTEHVDGGLFSAHFSYVGHGVYQYIDEYENTVSIMMAEPAIVSHINRITD